MFRPVTLVLLVALYVVYAGTAHPSAQSDGVEVITSDALLSLVRDFESFKKQLDSIDARLKTIQVLIEQKSQSGDGQCVARDIAEAIRSRRFKIAIDKLGNLADSKIVSSVIHDVYADSPINIPVILDFAKALSDPESQYNVYQALRDEMRASGNNDPIKLIEFIETIERELHKLQSDDLRQKMQNVIDLAVEDVKAIATSNLKNAMINNMYLSNVQVENIAATIHDFRTDVSNEVIERVVDGVFGVISADKILDNISSHKRIPQVITGLAAVFNRFNFAGNLNNRATLTLASHLRKLQQRPEYGKISREQDDDVNRVIEQLPTCAKNLFFSSHFCIWNKANAQYLYAASLTKDNDMERRHVFSWYPGDVPPGSFWQVEQIGADFFFKSRDYKDEYLYAANVDYNKDLRYIFTWVPGNNTDPQSAWSVDLDGEYCYLKSVPFNEYLFASEVRFDKLNSYAFTWKPGSAVKGSDFQWQIKKCGILQGQRK